MVKRALWMVLGVLLLLAAAVAVNTLRQGSRQLQVPPAPSIAVDEAAAADRLAGAIRFRTVSSLEQPQLNADQFRGLHAYLQQRYPRVHATLKREVVGELGLLYTWPGSDANTRPIALIAHHDVVPVAPGTEAAWTVPAFDGAVKDGYVWGRGAWDDKGNLIAQLEAIEMLLAAGFQPRQTVFLVSGADEEVGGARGAAAIARLLRERRVHLDFVLDEGLVITQGVIPGVAAPTALVGVAEKGYVSVQLKAAAAPGHSSMPPPPGTSAIARLGAALQRLEQEQFPAALQGVGREMFETLAPEMGGLQRVVLSNLWLFGPLAQRQLEQGAGTNAMLRTTTALTIVHAGNKENVIPGVAEATVNFRILPGETRETVLRRVRAVVGDGIELKELAGGADPSPVTSTGSPSYRLIQRTLRELFPGTIVTPALYIAGSDSQHFIGLTDAIYRFSPVRANAADLPRLHGTNERLATANLADLVRFYHQLLREASAAPATNSVSP
ncbi:M20 family peptidase [Ramlibacter sp.]|uniref:M20 family peptidase n=1 Tax=Ramlibacter sp. TaxID=1917967 RepID=UPI002BE53428|nr:M20 family peptidase [Ramlibacter sp.]HWI81243.1 M20 family peptidase [Ramlibacter sp.]